MTISHKYARAFASLVALAILSGCATHSATTDPDLIRACQTLIEKADSPEQYAVYTEIPEQIPTALPPAFHISVLGHSVPIADAALDTVYYLAFSDLVFLTREEGDITVGFTIDFAGRIGGWNGDTLVLDYVAAYDLAYTLTPETVDCSADEKTVRSAMIAMLLKGLDFPANSVPNVYRTDWGWLRSWQEDSEWRWQARYILDESRYLQVRWHVPISMKAFGWNALLPSQPINVSSVAAQVGACFENRDHDCLHQIEGAKAEMIGAQ